MLLFHKQIKVYKVYKRYYGYKGRMHEEFIVESANKKAAEQIADNLSKQGISKDGRINFEGIVR